jgi:hypothetical protein
MDSDHPPKEREMESSREMMLRRSQMMTFKAYQVSEEDHRWLERAWGKPIKFEICDSPPAFEPFFVSSEEALTDEQRARGNWMVVRGGGPIHDVFTAIRLAHHGERTREGHRRHNAFGGKPPFGTRGSEALILRLARASKTTKDLYATVSRLDLRNRDGGPYKNRFLLRIWRRVRGMEEGS